MSILRHKLPEHRRQARKERRIQRAVQALAWLDQQPYWQEGRIVWAPDGHAIERAATALNFLARRSDLIAPQRQARLWATLARALALAQLPLPLQEPACSADLVALLPAVALCRGEAPLDVVQALRNIGTPAIAPLQALCANRGVPPGGRALAALLLGALGAAPPHWADEAATLLTNDLLLPPAQLLRRAYGYGRAAGIPADPALTTAFLALPDGPRLLERLARAGRQAGRFALPTAMLHNLYEEGVSPPQIVQVAEALPAFAALAERMLPAGPRTYRRSERARRRWIDLLIQRVHTLAVRVGHAAVLEGALHILEHSLRLLHAGQSPDQGPAPQDYVLALLSDLANLPRAVAPTALGYVLQSLEAIWPPALLPADPGDRSHWYSYNWQRHGAPLLTLTTLGCPPEVIAEASHRRLAAPLAQYQLPDPALYGWALSRMIGLAREDDRACALITSVLSRFSDATRARSFLGPLLDAILQLPGDRRAPIVAIMLESVNGTPAQYEKLLRALTLIIPALADAPIGPWISSVLQAFRRLVERDPDAGPEQIKLLAPHLAARSDSGNEWWSLLRWSATIAATVTPDDPAQFMLICDTLLRVCDEIPVGGYRAAHALQHLPALHTAIGRLLPAQPYRVLRLFDRLAGMIALLPHAVSALQTIPGDNEATWCASDRQGWRELLALAPQSTASAAGYLYDCWHLGLPLDLPAGVARALGQPQRMAAEREYLAQRLMERPERSDLALRYTNLARYLAGDPWAPAAAEAAERLAQVAAERRLESVEQIINTALHEALIARTGRFYDGPLDDDLLNGLLFFAGEDVPQPLLQGLLRAHMAGDTTWRERLPENAAFLAHLLERGVDPANWLAAWPQVVSMAGAPGGRVTLKLATTPLQVLQMGNYFDTCLARDGVNAFSALTNAIDLNKRVLYAYSADGEVLGRQLIALSAEGCLLSYHCYTRGLDDKAREALAAVMRDYLLDFAQRCGIQTADHGEVENLVAGSWYDDGARPWTADEETGDRRQEIAGHVPTQRKGGACAEPSNL